MFYNERVTFSFLFHPFWFDNETKRIEPFVAKVVFFRSQLHSICPNCTKRPRRQRRFRDEFAHVRFGTRHRKSFTRKRRLLTRGTWPVVPWGPRARVAFAFDSPPPMFQVGHVISRAARAIRHEYLNTVLPNKSNYPFDTVL